ncbi:MAG: Uma2 family endonuclease [Rhodocyclaceae bacterium]|nr:Uma2 family endonuclease [Rhodocyclaceae bacterium]
MGLALRKDTGRYTYADYRCWPEEERVELIDGVAWAMGPAPSRRHQEIVLEIARQIADALEGSPCRPYIAPFDVRLPQADEADEWVKTVVQPDIAVICDKSKLDEAGCRGAPDWIVEVLSPATVARDQITKRALYERAGVREYWIVHPSDRVVTIYLWENGVYGKPAIQELTETTAATILPGVIIDWARVMRED